MKRTAKPLQLKRETLQALEAGQLRAAGGGATTTGPHTQTGSGAATLCGTMNVTEQSVCIYCV